MKQEYKKSRMLFQLVVFHLLLSDLELDSTAHKIFMLAFGKAEFDGYLRAKDNWNSDLEDFAEFALDHLVKAISLLPENKFSLSEILEIKLPIGKAIRVKQKANLLLKKRNYESAQSKHPDDDFVWSSKNGIIFASSIEIIQSESSGREQLQRLKQFHRRGYIRSDHLGHFQFLLKKVKEAEQEFRVLKLRIHRGCRAKKSRMILNKPETPNRKFGNAHVK